jgi:primosomal protein N' (replication factor Y) (superfamily II helicase)
MSKEWFADIILPFALKGRFTYRIPPDMQDRIVPGTMVSVQFGRGKRSSGIVVEIHDIPPAVRNIKTIIEAGGSPLVNEIQIMLWQWISEYYMCSEGEVMKAALPSSIYTDNYKSRLDTFIRLASGHTEKELNEILDRLGKARQQQALLSALIRITGYESGSEPVPVPRSLLLSEADCSPSIIQSLIKKGILSSIMLPVPGAENDASPCEPLKKLSETQQAVYMSVNEQFRNKNIVLLHGVTSSGKTEIYIHMIDEQIKAGRQVLYLLPEIALTTQIIERLKRHFGASAAIYHSKLSGTGRAEIWKNVSGNGTGKPFSLILGVRSSLFLPFSKLGLVIVDEEHDASYKQHDPAPRYHARDTAIMLASFHKAGTILGSASPSVESYYNAVSGKYGLAELKERFGYVHLPSIILANTREAYRKKLMVSHFSPELLEAMDDALSREEQIILFRNRRGFSPYVECPECGWIPKCIRCAVNLTYHKNINRLVCHYCGYSTGLPTDCGSCSSKGLVTRGYGTEKIEDEIKMIFPSARIARMDQDTTRSRTSFARIIRAFEERRTDILIGTQMISKGLDFENLTVVGILNADTLLNFPDFRAHERSFQMMEQVSGRAGRRQKQGKVVIQTADPGNKIIRFVVRHDYINMFRMQVDERKAFNYPPFCRMIRISVKHTDRALLNSWAERLGSDLKAIFGPRVLGPESPVIPQVQSWYIKMILLKIEKEKSASRARILITEAIERIGKEKGASALRIAVDVDPY